METNERIPFEHPKFKAFEARYQQILEKLLKLKSCYQPEVLHADPVLTFKLHSKLYLQELTKEIVGKGWLEGKI
jgi:hypothetical protein